MERSGDQRAEQHAEHRLEHGTEHRSEWADIFERGTARHGAGRPPGSAT